MTTATPTAEPLGLRTCEGAEVFTTRGLPGLFSRDDMLETVRNFYLLGPYRLALYEPPLGIGHDDDQDVLTALLEQDPRLTPWLTAATLDGTDGPAAGWVTGLKAVPDPDDPAETMLLADFEDVPDPIADLIDARAYKQVSAEIYANFPAAGRLWGKVLRRVALCGWQPPLNKALADLPATVAQFSEPRRIQRVTRRESAARPGLILCFSEMSAMNKAQMIAWLKANKMPLSDAAAAAMSDAEVKGVYLKFAEPAPMPAPAPMVPPIAKMDESPPMTRDQMIAEMQAAGADAAQLAALDDATLMTVYTQWKAQQANPTPAPVPAQVAAMAEVKKFAEQGKALVTTLTIEVAKAKNATDQIMKFAEKAAKQQKASKIAALRLELVGANGSGVAYCTPAEFAATHGPTLESLDDLGVHKFTEAGGKTFEGTAFDDYVRRVKSLPAKRVFSEKLPAEAFVGGGGAPEAKAAEDLQQVRAYADAHEAAILKFGETKDVFVKRFETIRTKMPTFTAAEYLKGLSN